MAQKREAEVADIDGPVKKRGYTKRPKKSRAVDLMPLVVDAIEDAEVLTADLVAVLKVALPFVLGANKADRHAYEVEVVDQAEKALSAVQAGLEAAHAEAMAKQSEVTAPAEHARRAALKKEAEAGEQAAQTELEAKKEAQSLARKTTSDMQSSLKAAEKELTRTEKETQALVEKKTNLGELLANELQALQTGTSQGPTGKKAVSTLRSIGKQQGLDDTMLQMMAITCKKEPENRTEFENVVFSNLKDAIDKQIEGTTQKLAELEPEKVLKLAALEECRGNVGKAEAASEACSQDVSTAQAACREAGKEVAKADDFLYQIWRDMKEACDAQDDTLDAAKDFKDKVMPAFQQMKEREPESEAKDDEPEVAAEEAGEAEAMAADVAEAAEEADDAN